MPTCRMMDGESKRGNAAEKKREKQRERDWIHIDWIQAKVVTTSWHLDQYRLLTVSCNARRSAVSLSSRAHRTSSVPILLYRRRFHSNVGKQTDGQYVKVLSDGLEITMFPNDFFLSDSLDHVRYSRENYLALRYLLIN